ncbi:hypothetical protein ABH924_002259, partial [Arthrobacter sp. GAS37]
MGAGAFCFTGPWVAIDGSLGLTAPGECNGSATCEVWEVPAMFELTF